jgi:hypothetical protein
MLAGIIAGAVESVLAVTPRERIKTALYAFLALATRSLEANHSSM